VNRGVRGVRFLHEFEEASKFLGVVGKRVGPFEENGFE